MDYNFKVVKRTIDWKIADVFPLAFFGDVHYDSSACDRDRFQRFIKQCGDEGRYVFGMGDYHDFASDSERKHLNSGNLHESTIEHFDLIVQERNRDFVSKLKPVKDRVLGLVGGNHTWKLASGYSSDEDLAGRLKTDYLGWLCVYRLRLKMHNNNYVNLFIVLCHGTGGGKLAGTSINKVDDLKRVFPFADIYVMGHDHQRGCWPTSTLWPSVHHDDITIKEKRQYLIRSGSFLKAYQEDKSQYTTKMLCRPADLGGVKMNIKIEKDQKTGAYHPHIESIV